MDNIKNLLNEEIERSLPKQVGEALQKRLQEAEKLEGKVRVLDTAINNLSEDLKKALEENSRLVEEADKVKLSAGFLESFEKILKDREEAIKERERVRDIDTLKIQLEEANKRANMVASFTASLVRNTEFRRDVFGSSTEIGSMHWNSSTQRNEWVGQGENKTYNHSETRREE